MSKQQKTMLTNVAQIDWLTLTSWELTSWQFWREVVENSGYCLLMNPDEDKKIMQYSGLDYSSDYGSAFIGTAFIGGREHIMLRVSGELSEVLFEKLAGYPLTEGWAKCTRIDLQITSTPPSGWDQAKMEVDLRHIGHKPSFITSFDRKLRRDLSTVYIGRRVSQRIARIYEKASDSREVYLRFEYEYKGELANKMARDLAKHPLRKEDYLLGEIEHLEYKPLEDIYKPYLLATGERMSVHRVPMPDKTRDWLLGVVIKSLEKYLNQHDNDLTVLDAFTRLIDEKWDKYRPVG